MIRKKILSKDQFNFFMGKIVKTGEYLFSTEKAKPKPGERVIFMTEDRSRVVSIKILNSCQTSPEHYLAEFKVVNYYPFGLQMPNKVSMDSSEAAAWMFLDVQSFRVHAARVDLPRVLQQQASLGVRYKFIYSAEDVWVAAVIKKNHETRIIRINEREKNYQFKGALVHA